MKKLFILLIKKYVICKINSTLNSLHLSENFDSCVCESSDAYIGFGDKLQDNN